MTCIRFQRSSPYFTVQYLLYTIIAVKLSKRCLARFFQIDRDMCAKLYFERDVDRQELSWSLAWELTIYDDPFIFNPLLHLSALNIFDPFFNTLSTFAISGVSKINGVYCVIKNVIWQQHHDIPLSTRWFAHLPVLVALAEHSRQTLEGKAKVALLLSHKVYFSDLTRLRSYSVISLLIR